VESAPQATRWLSAPHPNRSSGVSEKALQDEYEPSDDEKTELVSQELEKISQSTWEKLGRDWLRRGARWRCSAVEQTSNSESREGAISSW
jgi:hypothetical protein